MKVVPKMMMKDDEALAVRFASVMAELFARELGEVEVRRLLSGAIRAETDEC